MEIIPSIDIRDSKCVRLLHQSSQGKGLLFTSHALSMVEQWIEKGARSLHVVDLDGALFEEPKNIKTIEEIVSSVDIPVLLDGGVVDADGLENYFFLGVKQVILGEQVFANPEFLTEVAREYPQRLLISIRSQNGEVFYEAKKKFFRAKAVDLVRWLESFPVSGVMLTDMVTQDGQPRPNLEKIFEVVRSTRLPIFISGGIRRIADVQDLGRFAKYGISGLVAGQGLYEGTLDLEDAIRIAERLS